MIVQVQSELSFREACTEADGETLRRWLQMNGWQSRRQLTEGLGWSERRVRNAAELLGSDIVRGQHGFNLTSRINRDDLGAAKQAADAAISQGKRMIRYGIALKRRIHQFIS